MPRTAKKKVAKKSVAKKKAPAKKRAPAKKKPPANRNRDTSSKRGRPKLAISQKELAKLCELNVTLEEIAAFFDISERTLFRRLEEDPELKEIIDIGRAKGRLSIRRKLHEHLEKGDRAVAIFLAKAELGMSDRPDLKPPEDDGDAPSRDIVYQVGEKDKHTKIVKGTG